MGLLDAAAVAVVERQRDEGAVVRRQAEVWTIERLLASTLRNVWTTPCGVPVLPDV